MKKNILQETTSSKDTHQENGVLLEKNQGLKNIVNELNKIHEIIIKNQDISHEDSQQIMKSIQENFENTQFNICGEIVNINFIKKHGQEIEQNKDIWQEILDGNFKNHEQLTFLLDSVAESLSKNEEFINLNGLTSLTDEQAKSLSKHKGLFGLKGLTSLTDKQAESLSKHEGLIGLGGLTSLTDEQAESLSKHKGWMSLSGLTSLTDEQAKSLSKHEGGLGLSSFAENLVQKFKNK